MVAPGNIGDVLVWCQEPGKKRKKRSEDLTLLGDGFYRGGWQGDAILARQ